MALLATTLLAACSKVPDGILSEKDAGCLDGYVAG